MGQRCFKPKKTSLRIPVSYENVNNNVPHNNYQERLRSLLDHIYSTYLKKPRNENLISRTFSSTPITRHDMDDNPPEIPILEDITFFTDKFDLNDLEEFLGNCSNSSTSETDIELEDEDVNQSLYEKILYGKKMNIEMLTRPELESLLIHDKIHLKLAEKSEDIDKFVAILRKAIEETLIGDIVDLRDDRENAAISIAALNHNTKAVYYLIVKCHAEIPLHIHEESGKTPFLMYFAQRGKIYKSEDNKVEYLLLLMMNTIIKLYPKDYLLDHLKEIDKRTSLSLPHYLLNIYDESHDLKDQIKKCIEICMQYPGCAAIRCTNLYDPRSKFNVYSNVITSPKMDIETSQYLLGKRKATFASSDKKILRQLLKIHQDKTKRQRLKKVID